MRRPDCEDTFLAHKADAWRAVGEALQRVARQPRPAGSVSAAAEGGFQALGAAAAALKPVALASNCSLTARKVRGTGAEQWRALLAPVFAEGAAA